jgi:hypothetical protein
VFVIRSDMFVECENDSEMTMVKDDAIMIERTVFVHRLQTDKQVRKNDWNECNKIGG